MERLIWTLLAAVAAGLSPAGQDVIREWTGDLPFWTSEDNYRRLRVHRFAPRRMKAIRLTVRGTYGAQQAFENEIRVYAAN